MSELCFSMFAKCVKHAMQPPNGYFDAVLLLLDWIVTKPNVTNKYGDIVDLNQKLSSKLINRKDNVPKAIRDKCSTEDMIEDAIKESRETIFPRLNPLNKNDMFRDLLEAVKRDDDMAPESKENLLSDYKKDRASFFGWLLLYVICRDNRIEDESMNTDDIPFLAEVEYTCPLCKSLLIERLKDRSVRRYQVVYIYPKSTDNCAQDFKSVPKPENLNSFDNKIALCQKHAEEYMADTSVDEYNKLSKIKQRVSAAHVSKTKNNTLHLEDGIRKVLDGLSRITSDSESVELPLSALKLNRKIRPENFLMLKEETYRVLNSYSFIKCLFDEMEREDRCDFNTIAAEIRLAYLNLENANLPQEDIADRLAEWIRLKSGVSEFSITACRYVVSFFIQNCEVFNEISK